LKNLTSLEETECKKACYELLARSTEGRDIGRLITAEQSKGAQGNIPDRLSDIGRIFRQTMVDLYLQPPPRQL
jgi:hypothetical protein